MSSARNYGRAHKAGQAMVETILVLFFLFLAFYTVFQFADNLRARLLVDYAASRVARARTVGYNDFMLEKVARLAAVSASAWVRVLRAFAPAVLFLAARESPAR